MLAIAPGHMLAFRGRASRACVAGAARIKPTDNTHHIERYFCAVFSKFLLFPEKSFHAIFENKLTVDSCGTRRSGERARQRVPLKCAPRRLDPLIAAARKPQGGSLAPGTVCTLSTLVAKPWTARPRFVASQVVAASSARSFLAVSCVTAATLQRGEETLPQQSAAIGQTWHQLPAQFSCAGRARW